ncbi:hypothetical protein ACU686_16115 [Yinghuangia aomiensis]
MTAGDDRYRDLADLPFRAGYPAGDSARVLDEELFFQRAVQVYLWALPTVNMCAMRDGLGDVAGRGYQVVSVFEQRLSRAPSSPPRTATSSYGLVFADLAETGPLVVEAPPGIQGLVDDFGTGR